MEKKKSKIKSECCKAPIRSSEFAPDFIGDNPKTMTVGTVCCICTKCNKPCNFYIPVRRTWTRNPSTKVKGDERGKQKRKETTKEIRNNEDI